jgi:CNT family concentrative nucleoside transporter
MPSALKSLGLQVLLAVMLVKLPTSQYLFQVLDKGMQVLLEATRAGTSFIFGFLGGAELPYTETVPNGSFVLAFQTLPLVIVISVLSGLLIYWRVLPMILKLMSLLSALQIGARRSPSPAFLGMVESPLLIKPYLELSRSEFFGDGRGHVDHRRVDDGSGSGGDQPCR